MIKTFSTPVIPEEKKPVPCAVCGGGLFRGALSCEGFSYVRCAKCGLVQMNPQPLEEEIRRRYDTRTGTEYLSYELANEGSFLALALLALKDAGFDEIESELLAKPPARILDIGCATGSLLAHLRERGWETTGVEISGPQAEYGREKQNLDVRSLPLEENRFPAASFNVVLASHLIEHLNAPAAMAAEVNRILAPGGRFFVTTPNIAGFQARLFRGRWRSAIFDHLYLFSVKTLSRLLEEKGFVIEKTCTWGGLAAGLAPASVKRFFDKEAKRFGFGDVMIIRARREGTEED
ncbi:MAG: class I SAM-dependent methyltransferase [Treponema sp.]|jgi:2-polyprenyl-3-methyl-5-hydroxy-6-metoxy-1,4-benzoquinol methylase|nr:class I SAM-dependent methyltransferase [Treponema sp.]